MKHVLLFTISILILVIFVNSQEWPSGSFVEFSATFKGVDDSCAATNSGTYISCITEQGHKWSLTTNSNCWWGLVELELKDPDYKSCSSCITPYNGISSSTTFTSHGSFNYTSTWLTMYVTANFYD